MVKLLLKYGADINARDKDGWTSLHWGAKNGNIDMLKLLITNGADIKAKNKKGCIPLQVAKKEVWESIADIFESVSKK